MELDVQNETHFQKIPPGLQETGSSKCILRKGLSTDDDENVSIGIRGLTVRADVMASESSYTPRRVALFFSFLSLLVCPSLPHDDGHVIREKVNNNDLGICE